MHGLFGKIQISEEAHQRRQNPARFRPVKGLNGLAELFGRRRRHLRQASKRNGSIQLRSGFSYPQFISVAISCASSTSPVSPSHSSTAFWADEAALEESQCCAPRTGSGRRTRQGLGAYCAISQRQST